ncbi:AAA domain protein (macronuclear) [Tetrahymena thermophila SB210]|uniref:AAA domain protein n=1 Tax=Tetrahymena thermophila (strain SB210) TaxID=312017 RepID=I7LTW6_TETTS|nr:AAA domain protein [Tetrahymena thermophila SB210]EAR87420.1 AAA domain protein [Tetrahymena thermophila SB210]|eukprot:XP_001007665.1 AAA domain protein [Tetrahymena thermophila SB210]
MVDYFPVYKICLTGGPCAGKTTALTTLKEKLTEKGLKVFVVPEVPTLTMEGGGMIIMGGLTSENVCRFQSLLMKAQINLEDYFIDLAKLNGKPAVVLMDRGVMDPKGYMDDNTWQAVLDESGWNSVYLRDKRYDAVIHLVTAADGAEKFYTLENNVARYEDGPTAIKVDQALQNAWRGHPHHIIIDNSAPSFDKKIEKVINAVEKFVGIPVTTTLFRKFLVESYQIPADVKTEIFEVEEAFLKTDSEKNEFEKIRKRGQNNAFSYVHTVRQKSSNKEMRCEVKNIITAREYINLFEKRDTTLNIIKKTRIAFIYDKLSYILETFKGNTLLRYETVSSETQPKLPPFIKITKEVTDDKSFTTLHAAQAE